MSEAAEFESRDSASTACWPVTAERGFLMSPEALGDPRGAQASDAETRLLETAEALPELLAAGRYRQEAAALPPLAPGDLETDDARVLERWHQIYAFLANAYVWAPGEPPVTRLPATLAVPFVALSELVARPPVLSYANTQLGNWRRLDPAAPIALGNIETIQTFQATPDERWFWLVHIAIEAAAAPAVMASAEATRAARAGDSGALRAALATIADGLDAILALARRIPEGCDPNSYFRTLRPFLFGFEGLVYEGVERFAGKPRSFLGQTGAQSSVIPAIAGGLGVRHGDSDMTGYLARVRAFMPAPHRSFLASLDGAAVRRAAAAHGLGEAYNACLERLLAFRRHHLTLAATFIANKVEDNRGTGGTDFMRWLRQMTKETAAQRL